MSTPETTETTETGDPAEGCGCSVTEAEFDRWESFHAAKDLAMVGLLLWILRMATHDLAGGWTSWSYIALGALAMTALEALARLAVPAGRVLLAVFRKAARVIGRAVGTDLRRLSRRESRK